MAIATETFEQLGMQMVGAIERGGVMTPHMIHDGEMQPLELDGFGHITIGYDVIDEADVARELSIALNGDSDSGEVGLAAGGIRLALARDYAARLTAHAVEINSELDINGSNSLRSQDDLRDASIAAIRQHGVVQDRERELEIIAVRQRARVGRNRQEVTQ